MLLSAEVKDPLLKSLQETLSKQFKNMIQFREQVFLHKKDIREQEQMMRSRERKQKVDFSKAERKKELSTAVEMSFERRCAHDDRVDIFSLSNAVPSTFLRAWWWT
jgi:hypothetical protein